MNLDYFKIQPWQSGGFNKQEKELYEGGEVKPAQNIRWVLKKESIQHKDFLVLDFFVCVKWLFLCLELSF